MNSSLKYEMGPIRPPNEATSLLLRFTRNCPWNGCLFCHIYKGKRFEKRSLEELKRDIDTVKEIHDSIIELSWRRGFAGKVTADLVAEIFSNPSSNECTRQVAIWMFYGKRHVFIQDANSLAGEKGVIIEALRYLKEKFPEIDRITSYARSKTVAKRYSVEDLASLREAGLTRLHIGLETGYDFLLKYMNKGVTKAEHVEAGQKVRASGIELSEYVMPGLGGQRWWREHAEETADALNHINPHFIRLRTLKVLPSMPLYRKVEEGDFVLASEEEIVVEERLMIERLEGIESYIKSDHALNLLEEIDGKLPETNAEILSVIDRFLSLPEEERLIFRFGRRAGIYRTLDDLKDDLTYFRIKKTIREMEAKEAGSVERTISVLLENYI